MGAPTAQVQQAQTSQPAGKGAGVSPSSDTTSMGLSALSGQPRMGQPNTNSNTPISSINPNFVAQNDGVTNNNPYPNTIGNMTMVQGGINAKGDQSPVGKGAGGGQANGKGV